MTALKSDRMVLDDAIQFSRILDTEGLTPWIRELSRPSNMNGLMALTANWLVIIACVLLVAKVSFIFCLIAIPIIGSRQRAMSNLIHDASHSNLLGGRRWNDRATNFLAGYPMLETVANYRKSHAWHHRFLGVPELDPDLQSHMRYGFDDHNPPNEGSTKRYVRLALNFRSWRDSLAGSITQLSTGEANAVTIWWTLVSTIGLVLFPTTAILFISLWWISRATSYHLIRIFAEFLDHTGLKPGSVFGFTRNVPGGLLPLQLMFHPHSDNFHLVHHLLPQIPHYRLKRVHRLLLQNDYYRRGHHCDGYFIGQNSAIKSWAGRN